MKDLFCTKCAATTPHNGDVDVNGELLFTCADCGHFAKFPAVEDAGELEGLIAEHEATNRPLAEAAAQAGAQRAILEEVLDDGTTVTVK